jgi:outer membrane murein-binding lipoprotein Lpp
MERRLVKRLSLIALTGLVGCLVLAACGNGRLSKPDYRNQLGVILKSSTLAHSSLSLAGATARTVPQLQTHLRRFAAAQDRLGDEIAALKPPKDAEAANALIARGAHHDAAEVRTLIPKLSKYSTVRQALHFLNGVGHTKGGQELDRATRKLRKLGYIT